VKQGLSRKTKGLMPAKAFVGKPGVKKVADCKPVPGVGLQSALLQAGFVPGHLRP
jgi:hypothetical protein